MSRLAKGSRLLFFSRQNHYSKIRRYGLLKRVPALESGASPQLTWPWQSIKSEIYRGPNMFQAVH